MLIDPKICYVNIRMGAFYFRDSANRQALSYLLYNYILIWCLFDSSPECCIILLIAQSTVLRDAVFTRSNRILFTAQIGAIYFNFISKFFFK